MNKIKTLFDNMTRDELTEVAEGLYKTSELRQQRVEELEAELEAVRIYWESKYADLTIAVDAVMPEFFTGKEGQDNE